MMNRSLAFAFLACLATSMAAVAQQLEPYAVPRTAHGHPDFQGVWATEFLTMLERPPGVEHLSASPEQARALAEALRTQLPEVIDPQVDMDDVRWLLRVRGEYRTSVIVEPEDGKMPFTEAGAELAARILVRNETFDDPDQRPLAERCMENLYPPLRPLPLFLPHQILQTRDHVVIASEGPASVRMIHLGGEAPPETVRSVQGHSTGRWDGDTLVVTTTHLRADDPTRDVIGRPLLLSRETTITERFTRVAEGELLYQFTVDDDEQYTQPWMGELSLRWFDGPLYEYACHEGNYSLPLALSGGRAQDREAEAGR